jgi:hypothetical protein
MVKPRPSESSRGTDDITIFDFEMILSYLLRNRGKSKSKLLGGNPKMKV